MIARLKAIDMFDNDTMKAMVVVCDLNIVVFSSPRAFFLQLLRTNLTTAQQQPTTATNKPTKPIKNPQNEQEITAVERSREKGSLPVAWRCVHNMFFFLELRRFIRMQFRNKLFLPQKRVLPCHYPPLHPFRFQSDDGQRFQDFTPDLAARLEEAIASGALQLEVPEKNW